MGNQHHQRQGRGRNFNNRPGPTEFVVELENVELVFFETTLPVQRGGEYTEENVVIADYSYDLGNGTSVPVTVKPEKFVPKLWSPDRSEEDAKPYMTTLRILANHNGYFGFARPAKGTVLLDDEQVAIVRLTGPAMDRVAFKIRGNWGDGSPKYIGYSRKFGDRPVILLQGLTVDENRRVPVALTENIGRGSRKNDNSLIGRPVLRQERKVDTSGTTVQLREPTGTLPGLKEAATKEDFFYATSTVSIYNVLSSKKHNLTVTEDTKPADVRKAINKRMEDCNIERFVNKEDGSMKIPLLLEVRLGCYYDAVEQAGDLALALAIARFGDEPTDTTPGSDDKPRRRRDRNRGRNRHERNDAEGQVTEAGASNEAVTEDTTETAPEAQAEGDTIVVTVIEGESARDTVPAPAPTDEAETTEADVTVEIDVEVPEAQAPVIDATIVARAQAIGTEAEMLEAAFMVATSKAGTAGLTLEAFLAKDPHTLRSLVRFAKSAKTKK